jgi:cadmium resistance transport/sequestration family protein
MDRLLSVILVGITSFIATNLDDIVVLVIFFSQVSATFRRRHIVFGQYLGFTALLLLSLPGYFGGLVLPKAWVGLLGLLPLGVGVGQLLNPDTDEPDVQTVSMASSMASESKASIRTVMGSLLSPKAYQVAAVTIANGGDNIGIYVPLFASSTFPRLAIIVSVFLVLVGVWCWVAERLTRQRAIALLLSRYGHRAIPFVLIGLGLYILIDCGTLAIFMSWVPQPR